MSSWCYKWRSTSIYCVICFLIATSKADVYAVPTVAVTQDLSGLGIPVVLGVGVSATSGIGVDYKHTSNSLGAAAELINLVLMLV